MTAIALQPLAWSYQLAKLAVTVNRFLDALLCLGIEVLILIVIGFLAVSEMEAQNNGKR
ncbi:MAG TPA: hypothetical protein VES89_02940 [Candidatus Competibacteraceae bacterium]|nr:hypothetical protein [Candidatus Competibacteraceae bacterium]